LGSRVYAAGSRVVARVPKRPQSRERPRARACAHRRDDTRVIALAPVRRPPYPSSAFRTSLSDDAAPVLAPTTGGGLGPASRANQSGRGRSTPAHGPAGSPPPESQSSTT